MKLELEKRHEQDLVEMRYEHGEQMRMAQEADEQYQVDLKEYQQKREEELDEYLAQQRKQQKETDKCEQYEALVSKQNHENHRRYLKQKQDAETQHLDDEHERRHQAILNEREHAAQQIEVRQAAAISARAREEMFYEQERANAVKEGGHPYAFGSKFSSYPGYMGYGAYGAYGAFGAYSEQAQCGGGCQECSKPPTEKIVYVENPSDATTRAQITRVKAECQTLQEQIAKYKRQIAEHVPTPDNYGLGANFFAVTRTYACHVPSPGIAYRLMPSFQAKSEQLGTGPMEGQCIKADRICQGPRGVFVRDAEGHGWVPTFDPAGTQAFFTVLSPEQAEAQNLKVNTADSNKLSWFQATKKKLEGK